jgi:hypothetical protein
VITLNLLGIPQGADTLRDWIVWGAAIIGGVVAISIGFYRIFKWLRGALASTGYDLLEPKFDEINAKMDDLKAGNEAQHAEVASQIHELRAELTAHRIELTEHLSDSTLATEQLQTVTDAVNLHVAALRNEITSPGLPVVPKGPPPGRKPMF